MSLNIINNLVTQAKSMMQQTHNIIDLNAIRVKFLGKQGYITQQIKILNRIPIKNRAKIGAIINQAKNDINIFFTERKNILKSKNIQYYTTTNSLDITLPGRCFSEPGTIHPITNTIKNIKYFFNNLGFSTVYGPEIENDYFNFQALNMPINHPARDEHDTFWLNKKYLLRTHTSGIQIRSIRRQTPPIRIISFGRVYRKDYDKNHTPMFHQMEGIIVDTHINFSNLKKILYDFLYYLFKNNINIRFRPSYFPFTEPSAEIDAIKKKQISSNWIELLGCGMIHPKILHNVGVNPEKFSGFAFGMGIERLTMLLYNIEDMRIFFKNDLAFLQQFK